MTQCPDCGSTDIEVSLEIKHTGKTEFSKSPIRVTDCLDCEYRAESDMAVQKEV